MASLKGELAKVDESHGWRPIREVGRYQKRAEKTEQELAYKIG